MLFSALEFIFLFLPISVGVYFLLPRRCKNVWLLLSGLLFYGIGEPRYLPLMVFTILADYLFGRWLEKNDRGRTAARGILAFALVFNIGQLALFKYFDPLGWGLPIGISFYTFQALSYVIDVYRRKVSATGSIVDFGAYVSLFPQLIAGPIVKYSDLERELKERKHSTERIAWGVRTFCAGLAKKVILANPAGEMWELLSSGESAAELWLGVLFFSFQIYFDFSGYSDMAVGLGRVFGFDFPQNFNYPYISQSITEFWRRWHMTLSGWFREYVYIPLGGNRGGRLKTYRNLLLTWILTGIWHGAGVNFLLWGLYFALILIMEKAFLGRWLEKAWSSVRHVYSLLLIGVGWIIFALDGSIVISLKTLMALGEAPLWRGAATSQLVRNIPFIMIMAVGCTPLPKKLYLKIRERIALVDIVLPVLSFGFSLAYIVSSGYDPFLYFRF